MSDFFDELAAKRLKWEVMKLRREALEIARGIIREDERSEGMTEEEIELAACDLCDRQVQEIEFQKEQENVNTGNA